MKLIIVESPNKCDTISRYVGSEYKVMASKGHIRDLTTSGKGALGIDTANGFTPRYKVVEGKEFIVKQLQEAARKSEEVILATDPDREGEAISWHLASVLGLDIATTKRLQFHEITKPAILEALDHPGHIDMNLVNAQETRRMYDRIIGFKLSGLLKKKMGVPSAGRVQSVTLRMICDNDEEIAAFVPEEYWVIEVVIEVDGQLLELAIDKVGTQAAKPKTKEEAQAILDRIGTTLKLVSLKKKLRSVAPPMPFTTSTMQQEAFNRFRFSTEKTQRLAQQLYEGLEIYGEHVGLISYMRTDSTRISQSWYDKHARPFILEQLSDKYLGSPRLGKKLANAQDAHEAIRPTGTHRTPDKVDRYLTSDQSKLYRLIYTRAMASLMANAQVEQTTATFDSNGVTFKATGSRVVFDGFMKMTGEKKEEDLPLLEEGKSYVLHSKDAKQKFTEPPARYTEARVVKLMEEKGIGRPSTYASTLKNLMDHDYIGSEKGVLSPTYDGLRTTRVLKKYFPEVVSEKYTASMEHTLDEIEEGKMTKNQAMEDFYEPFMEKFEEVSTMMYKDPPEETGEVCPVCGQPLVYRKGKYGTFIACIDMNCGYIKGKEKPELLDRDCPLCGKPLVKRVYKKTGDTFIGCSGFPQCRYTESSPDKPKTAKTWTKNDIVKHCPNCEGYLIIKQGRRKRFLGCTNFPRCHYHEWIDEKNPPLTYGEKNAKNK